MTNPPKVRVALIFGGVSSEHEISCLTAGGVARAIDPERFEVIGIGITGDGCWVRIPIDELSGYEISDGRLPRVASDRPEAVLLRGADGAELATREGDRLADITRIDVAFALLHGPWGEDGTIQGLFEMYGLRYVGSGVTASAVSMDKIRMKQLLALSGLPIGPWVGIRPDDWARDPAACLDAVEALRFPVFVKPARAGSSVGITKVADSGGLRAAIAEARRWDPKVIVEESIEQCREIECGVLADRSGGRPKASVVAEIETHTDSGFYDFEAKYTPEEDVALHVPADLDPRLATQIRELSVRVFEAFECEGLARIDCFLTRDNKVLVNELNTMPGFTKFSMFPQVWQASGMSYPNLIGHLVELALARPLGLR